MKNIFRDIPADLAEEWTETLATLNGARIERIVSTGQFSPPGFWYDQNKDEWVLVVEGAAHLRFEDEAEPRSLAPGDWLHIAAHRRHRIEWTAKGERTIWLAVFEQNRG